MRVGKSRACASRGGSMDGRGDDRATAARGRGQVLDVDFRDGAVDAIEAGLALGDARVVVHAELGVVFGEQRARACRGTTSWPPVGEASGCGCDGGGWTATKTPTPRCAGSAPVRASTRLRALG